MPNFTLSEILTIMLVILIVFGPNRLPEMAQKAGQLVRRARSVVNELRQEFEGEWQEVSQPLKDVRQEMMGIKGEMDSSMTSLSDDVAKAKAEIEADLAKAKDGIVSNGVENRVASGEPEDTVSGSSEESDDEEPQQ
jgi:sec-independent protein translocase protein TatB